MAPTLDSNVSTPFLVEGVSYWTPENRLLCGQGALMAETEVYFEFVQVGQQMRVAAVDAATGTEVIVITPVSASKSQMQQIALAKLRKKLAEAAATAPAGPSGKFA
jgi:hypothetical protein